MFMMAYKGSEAGPVNGVVLVVNVRGSWPAVLRGETTAQEAVLGDWNLRDVDPHRVAAVLGSYLGRIVAAFAVDDHEILTQEGAPDRVRFAATRRLRHLEGMNSPYKWQRGELNPVVPLPLADQPFALDEDGADVELDGFTLHVTSGGDAVVSAPAGRSVTVRGAPPRPREATPEAGADL